jgi:hypothetical protein
MVRAIIGHSTTAMTHHYSHVDENEKPLAATRKTTTPAPKFKTPPLRGVLLEVPPRFERGNGGFAGEERLSAKLIT